MIEILLAYAVLLESNLIKFDEYEEYINRAFLENPENKTLLDLQCCYSDKRKSIDTIQSYWRNADIDYNMFGKFLMKKLKLIYSKNELDIKTYGLKVYSLWNLLPSEILQKEPFQTMSYADDPLAWGDEKQTRSLYEKMFEYFE